MGGIIATFGLTAVTGGVQPLAGPFDLLSIHLRTAGLILVAALLLPSLAFSFLRIVGAPVRVERPWLAGRSYWAALGGVALVWFLAWLLSTQVFKGAGPSWSLAPPLYLLVTGLPVAFWFLLAAHGLTVGSAQRRWGLLAATLAGSTLVIIVVELLAMVAILILAAGVLASRPDWAAQVNQLARQLSNMQIDPETLTRILTPYLTQPWVVYLALALVSGLIPLIEEALKPLAVWILASRRPTPSEGFVAGLICGAGFALFESLGMLSTFSGDTWPAMALGRAGTDLLHMTTSSLLGWALASAWQNQKYWRLWLAYLGAVAAHGLWNLASLSSSIPPTLAPFPSPLLRLLQSPLIAGRGIGLVALLLLAILLILSGYLRAHQPASLVESKQIPEDITLRNERSG